MDKDEHNDIYAYVKNIEPWDCKIMIDGTDIAPLLTCIPEFEKHFQKHHSYPKTTRHRFDPNKCKGVDAQNELVIELKRECHFRSFFHLSIERTKKREKRLPKN